MTNIRFDLKSNVSLWVLAQTARGVFAWWRGQMWDLTPSWLRRWLSDAFGRLTIVMEDGQWRVVGSADDQGELLLDPAAPDDELRDRLKRFDPARLEQRVDAVIHAEHALARTIKLPLAAAARLRSVVELQLGRISPLRAEDVRFDFRRVGEPSNAEFEVEVWVVPTRILRAYEQRLAALGLAARRFRLAGHDLEFMPCETGRTAGERLQIVLAAAAAAAFAAAMLLAPLLRSSELGSLSAEIAALRKPAHDAAMLRAELSRLQAPMLAASAALQRPAALDVLLRLTELAPADAQLSDLTIDGSQVRIRGSCRDAKRFVALLNTSGAFARAALTAPAGKAADGRDMFEIAMTAVQVGAER